MSWLFSRALVEEFLGESSSDGEPSAPSSGSPTQLAYLPPDKTTAFSRLSRFGMTFKPLTADRGEELLTLYLADFHAKTSALQEKAQALTASEAGCGSTWRGWLAKFDPVTSSWRTAQCSFIEDLNESYPTLPRSGMTRDGLLWEQPMLERPISATGFGLWPTPTSSLGTNGGRVTPTKAREGGTLIEALSARTMWPTPTANQFDVSDVQTLLDRRERVKKVRKNGNGFGLTLAQAVKVEMWPTPIASDSRGSSGKPKASKQVQLVDAVRFATPTRRDYKSGRFSPEAKAQRDEHPRGKPLNEQIGGSLNPTWVEWLMGWPLGWTDLKPSATDRCHSAPQQPSENSQQHLSEAA